MGNTTSSESSSGSRHSRRQSDVAAATNLHRTPSVTSSNAPPPYVANELPAVPPRVPSPDITPVLSSSPTSRSSANRQVSHGARRNASGSRSPPIITPTSPNKNGSFRAQSDPPPPLPPRQSTSSRRTSGGNNATGANRHTRRTSTEDPLELLRKYDTIFVVDDSSSMEGPLWYEAREALAGLADVAAKYDTNGVDVHFLNSEVKGENLSNGSEVKRLFDRIYPVGITPTGEKLEELLLDYLLRLEDAKAAQLAGEAGALKKCKPVNFLVITDGVPTDEPEPVIVQAAKRLDSGRFPLSQVGIQFVQIGNDPEAAESLRKLDDDLSGEYGIRDMVDTFPFSAEGGQLTTENLAKILLGGINRRQDRQRGGSVG